jgi:hypothetical protein
VGHLGNAAANEFLFPRAANSEKDAAGQYLNKVVKEGMAKIEPTVPEVKCQGKCYRRGAVQELVLHRALRNDLLPGSFCTDSLIIPLSHTNSLFSHCDSFVYGELAHGCQIVRISGRAWTTSQTLDGQ